MRVNYRSTRSLERVILRAILRPRGMVYFEEGGKIVGSWRELKAPCLLSLSARELSSLSSVELKQELHDAQIEVRR